MDQLRTEPAIVVAAATAALVTTVGAAASRTRSRGLALGVGLGTAAAGAIAQGLVTRSLVAPAHRVDDARNLGAAEMLDAVAESRLDADMWEAIRAVAPAPYTASGGADALDPTDPHGMAGATR